MKNNLLKTDKPSNYEFTGSVGKMDQIFRLSGIVVICVAVFAGVFLILTVQAGTVTNNSTTGTSQVTNSSDLPLHNESLITDVNLSDQLEKILDPLNASTVAEIGILKISTEYHSIVLEPEQNDSISIEWQRCLGGSREDSASSIQQTSDLGYIVVGTAFSTDGDVSGNHGSYDIWVVKMDVTGKIEWQSCFGGSKEDYPSGIHQTSDGGYLLLGKTGYNDSDLMNGWDYVWVVKLDAGGEIEWQQCPGGSKLETLPSFTQTTPDGGYLLVGSTNSTDGDVSGHHGRWDAWVVKLDPDGSIVWQRCLGGSSYDGAYHGQQTPDGGYIVAGKTYSNDGDVSGHHGDWDAWVVKLHADGSIAWQRCLGGSDHDYESSIQQTSDGGYIVAGETYSNDGDVSGNHGWSDTWVVKLDADGEIKWQRCFGGSSGEWFSSIQQTPDGGYIVAGQTLSKDGDVSGHHGDWDAWVVKLDAEGEIEWHRCLGGSSLEWFSSIQQTSDGGYIVAGYTYSTDGDVIGNHGDSDIWVVKLDAGGEIVWQRCLGGSNHDIASSIQQTVDEGFVVAGTASSTDGDVIGNHGSYDLWVVKLESFGSGTVPVAAFTANITSGPAPLTVQFTDISTGAPIEWAWEFGDGATSTEQHPVHTYTTAGAYTVNLTVTNGYDSDETSITDYITVRNGTISIIASGDGNPAPGDVITLSGNNTDSANTHLFLTGPNLPASGVNLVNLSVPVVSGNTSTFTIAAVEIDETWEYIWDTTSVLGRTLEEGTYTVYAASQPKEFSDLEGVPYAQVAIRFASPVQPGNISFVADQTSGVAPLTVQFTDTSANSPTAWLWTFGDGNTSIEQHPTHTYAAPGNYTVALAVNGGTETCTRPTYIKVTPLLYGDANDDGAVNQADTLRVLREVVDLVLEPATDTDEFRKTDVHTNGVIEVGDALFIAQYNVGLRDVWFALNE